MGLADALKEHEYQPTRPLRIQAIYDRLSEDDQKALLDALHDPDVPQRVLAGALQAEGHRLSPTAIGDARRQGWEPTNGTR